MMITEYVNKMTMLEYQKNEMILGNEMGNDNIKKADKIKGSAIRIESL